MDRLNHVKIVTPDPAAVDRFLREVVDIPERAGRSARCPTGPRRRWTSPARATPSGNFSMDGITEFRGSSTTFGGFITGSTESRQFQIFQADAPKVWGIAIGTRNLERAHERCVERGIPCTEPTVTPWGDDGSIELLLRRGRRHRVRGDAGRV